MTTPLNTPDVIAGRLKMLTPKELEALNEAVSTLYFNDSSKFRGALWSIIRDLLGLDVDEVTAFDENVWAAAMNPDWRS